MSSNEHPDWLLERIRLQEVPSHFGSRSKTATTDPTAQARLEELAQAQAAFEAQDHQPELSEIHRVAAAQARIDAAKRLKTRRKQWGIAIPLAAMSLVLAVFPWQQKDPATRPAIASESAQPPTLYESATTSPQGNKGPAEAVAYATATGSIQSSNERIQLEQVAGTGSLTGNELIRAKGDDVAFLIYRKQNGTTQRLSSGDTVSAGDMLQLSVEAQHLVYLCIVSLDSAGALTAHLPEMPSRAMVMDSGMRMILPHAYELDASPGFERFVLVWSHTPFETSPILAALRKLPQDLRKHGKPEFAGLQMRSILFPKARP